MPGPGNKRKSKSSTNAKARGDRKETTSDAQATSTHANSPSLLCLTLEEDEITRCSQLATEGHPKPDRCRVHHGQYRILFKKYKDASKVVDDIKGGTDLPTKEQIGRYTDSDAALEKSQWMCSYLEAIRVEQAGREIHQKRFFLTVDDGHKHRLELLQTELIKAVDLLDTLQRRAFELSEYNGTLHAMKDQARSTAEVDLDKQSKPTTEEVLESVHNPDAFHHSTPPIPRKEALSPTPAVGDEDLINMALRAQKEKIIMISMPFFDLESFVEEFGNDDPHLKTGPGRAALETRFFIYQQYVRRIVFHQPSLFMKSSEKVSFKDLILSDDVSTDDLTIFHKLFWDRFRRPLRWFKDAVLDALTIPRDGPATNVGGVESRFPLLGGWIFDRSPTVSMPNEAWWFLLKMLEPPANLEEYFVRVCNNFDDLVGFLSFEAFGLIPSPSFCESPPDFDVDDLALSRNHLSLSGIIVADTSEPHSPDDIRGPLAIIHRATINRVMWHECEIRAFMFGAMRNEPDAFVDAFLRELRSRPDLFQVVLRSETAPSREVEMFGSGPLNNEALPLMRKREYEAPLSPTSRFAPPISMSGEWEVCWPAIDLLYGTEEVPGYLTPLEGELDWGFFRSKTFPVTYFVILDTVPYRDRSVLARNVSWAALRAGGYAEGEYTASKYAVAGDNLLEKCAQERLGWMPEEMKCKIPRMQPRAP